MADINNSYKRFQTYTNSAHQNTFKQDFMEQNYKFEKKKLNEKRELPKVDSAFIERTTRLGVNREGQFFKK